MAHLGKVGGKGGAGQGGQGFAGIERGELGDQRGQGGQHLLALGSAKGDKADDGGDKLGGDGVEDVGDDVLGRQVQRAAGMAKGEGIGQGRWFDPGQGGNDLAKGGAPCSRISSARSAEGAKA